VGSVTYGIPWLGHAMCLLYNADLLTKAGVDPASLTSREALVKAIEAVEIKTGARGFGLVGADSNDVSWMVNQFIYGFGSSLVSADGQSVAVNNDASRAAIDFYKNTLGKHAQDTWTSDTGVEVMSYFRKQDVAFEIQGIWGVTDIIKNGSPFKVGIIPLKNVGLCAEVGPMLLAIPVSMSASDKAEAVRFIRYMISLPSQEQIMIGEYSPEHDAYYPFRTPIRRDMEDSEFFKNNTGYYKFIEGFQNPSIDVPVPAWQTVKDEVYQPGLHQVMTDQATIDEFLDRVEKEGNRLLSEQK
jgi:multiple sugar transport system substrate-binding protein